MGISPSLQPDPNGRVQPPSGSPPPEQNWRFETSGKLPAFAWALAALLGAGSISASPRDAVIRLVLPVVVMVTYVVFAYQRDSGAGPGLRDVRIAQLADSAYFLGFLWTLWALIDSFVLKGATGAETAFRVFGYALVTTAAGMFIRLYLLQFKYGASDQAAEAELTVERNLQIFSTAMQDASRSIRSFQEYAGALNRDVVQLSKSLEAIEHKFADTHQETTKTIKDSVKAVVEEIRGALKAPIQEYGRAIRAFTANVNQQSQLLTETLQKSSTDVVQAVKESTEKARLVIQETGERIAGDHIELSERLRGQVALIGDELRDLSVRLASIGLPTDDLKRVVGSFSELEQAFAVLVTILGPEGRVRVNLSDFADEIEGRAKEVEVALDDVAGRLRSMDVPREVSIDISNVTRSIEELQKAIEGLLQKAGDQRWERVPQSASEAVIKLTASVNNLRHSLDSTDESIKKKGWLSWFR